MITRVWRRNEGGEGNVARSPHLKKRGFGRTDLNYRDYRVIVTLAVQKLQTSLQTPSPTPARNRCLHRAAFAWRRRKGRWARDFKGARETSLLQRMGPEFKSRGSSNLPPIHADTQSWNGAAQTFATMPDTRLCHETSLSSPGSQAALLHFNVRENPRSGSPPPGPSPRQVAQPQRRRQ